MILNIYLSTTVISCIFSLISACDFYKYTKRKGYASIKNDKTFIENFFKVIIQLLCPIYNVFLAGFLITRDNDTALKSMVERGFMYRSVEEPLINELETNNSTVKENGIKTENNQKTATEKTYDEMTVKEKIECLEQEKKNLMKQCESLVEESFMLDKTRK